jgi:hypothetical protein
MTNNHQPHGIHQHQLRNRLPEGTKSKITTEVAGQIGGPTADDLGLTGAPGL